MSAASLACGLRSLPITRRSGRRNGTRRALVLSETLPFNVASGGTVSEFVDAVSGKRRRVHVFAANAALVVALSARPWRLLVQGGGAGWGVFWDPSGTGSGGGSGGTIDTTVASVSVDSHSVAVGARGANGGYQSFGGNGGTSSVFGITATGGTTNGNYPMSDIYRGTPPGGSPTGGLTSDITGTNYSYAGNHGGSNYGAGSTWSPHGGGAGGVVIASYEVAA